MFVPLYALSLVLRAVVTPGLGSPSASSLDGNLRRNILTGRMLPWAPVSILAFSLCVPAFPSTLTSKETYISSRLSELVKASHSTASTLSNDIWSNSFSTSLSKPLSCCVALTVRPCPRPLPRDQPRPWPRGLYSPQFLDDDLPPGLGSWLMFCVLLLRHILFQWPVRLQLWHLSLSAGQFSLGVNAWCRPQLPHILYPWWDTASMLPVWLPMFLNCCMCVDVASCVLTISSASLSSRVLSFPSSIFCTSGYYTPDFSTSRVISSRFSAVWNWHLRLFSLHRVKKSSTVSASDCLNLWNSSPCIRKFSGGSICWENFSHTFLGSLSCSSVSPHVLNILRPSRPDQRMI